MLDFFSHALELGAPKYPFEGPIFELACTQHGKLVKQMLELGLKPTSEKSAGSSKKMLSLACEKGDFDAANALLQHGYDVNYNDGSAKAALPAACEGGNFELARFLLKNGANVSKKKTNVISI